MAVMATQREIDKQSMQDLHHADPATVEYFRKIVVYLRYDDGLQEELTEVDQIVQMELNVVQRSLEAEDQVGALRFQHQSWVGMVSLCCWPP